MSSIIVIIGNVIPKQTAQMDFINYNHMVEKLSAATPDPALSNSILPRTLKACPFGADSTRYQKISRVIAKFLVSIEYHIPIGISFWECPLNCCIIQELVGCSVTLK